jgi:hypothetical protein
VLVCNDLDEGSQSELSQAIPLGPKSVSMLEGPPEAEITTICCHPGGDFVFCGKQDGSVSYFETRSATQRGILYRHAANIGVTCIAYSEERRLLITADESGRVLVNEVMVSQAGCEFVNTVAEIRSEESLRALLPGASGTRILIQRKRSAEVWTTEGEKVGFSIPFNDDRDEDRTMVSHPLDAEHFISIGRKDMCIYSWADAVESRPIVDEKIKAPSPAVTPPSPEHRRTRQRENWSDLCAQQQSSDYIVNLLTGSPSSSAPAALEVWHASSISASNLGLPPRPLPGFDGLAHKVRQIIAVTGGIILFLDIDLWVCSLNVMTFALSGRGAERHFFLLSEWQSSDRSFIIEYVPTRREFLVARKHGLLVVRRGLDLAEPWSAK